MPEKHKSCESHCCARHGCKYGHEDCPVVMMRLEQLYPCEYCPDLSEIQDQMNYWANEMTFWKVLQEQKEKREKDVR